MNEASTDGRQAIRVLIVDDHLVVREGLRAFLSALDDIRVVGDARDGASALRRLEELAGTDDEADVVLMDLLMEPMDGIEATRRIKERLPSVEVVAMTSFVDEARVLGAMEAGASGYLLKDAEADQVAEAIRGAMRGEVTLNPRLAALLMSSLRRTARVEDPLERLTEREREVLALVGKALTNRQIAEQLVVSERTVRTHVSNILAKLDLRSRTQAALVAVREGLVADE